MIPTATVLSGDDKMQLELLIQARLQTSLLTNVILRVGNVIFIYLFNVPPTNTLRGVKGKQTKLFISPMLEVINGCT